MGVESDIKEIYDRIVVLEKLYHERGLERAERIELIAKYDIFAEWVKKVSKVTGVSSPKL